MLVFGEGFQSDPEYQSGQTEFWCVCTSRGSGPDGGEVTLSACRNLERSCYQEY